MLRSFPMSLWDDVVRVRRSPNRSNGSLIEKLSVQVFRVPIAQSRSVIWSSMHKCAITQSLRVVE
jgi:hypothetical protein